MAQQVTIRLVDDLDGSEATITLSFGFDAKSYEIDLNEANANEFKKVVSRYINSARLVSSVTRRAQSRTRNNGSQSKIDVGSIKQWARENGLPYPERGRLPHSLIAQWEAASVS